MDIVGLLRKHDQRNSFAKDFQILFLTSAVAPSIRPYLSNSGRHSTPSPKHHASAGHPLLYLSRIRSASAPGDPSSTYASSASARLASSSKQRSAGGRYRVSISATISIARRASSGKEP